jgi:4-aminobutyrate---pyruvate transaminase
MATEFAAIAQKNGLIVRPNGERIVLAPPIVITEAEVDELFRRFNKSMDELLEWAS